MCPQGHTSWLTRRSLTGRVRSLASGTFSLCTVLSRPLHRSGKVVSFSVLPGFELLLSIECNLHSVVGAGSFERYRCTKVPSTDDLECVVDLSYGDGDVQVERSQPVVSSFVCNWKRGCLWMIAKV